jgi:hypothetical protein
MVHFGGMGYKPKNCGQPITEEAKPDPYSHLMRKLTVRPNVVESLLAHVTFLPTDKSFTLALAAELIASIGKGQCPSHVAITIHTAFRVMCLQIPKVWFAL